MAETEQTLGRLIRVDLRDIWSREADDFTPWLVREENLTILGETLGIDDLELEAQEKAVGPFRADVLCKDIGTGTWVLIENQLERTDHGHLGQWRIGESPAAPKFNVVSKPNDWSRLVAQAERSIEDSELSETKVLQLAYWDAPNSILNKTEGPVSGDRKPQPRALMDFSIGRGSDVSLVAAMSRSKRRIRAGLYIKGNKAKAHFHQLTDQKDTIE